MKVILLKDVPKVGQRYEIKEVADGFALNSLLPKGLAQKATPDIVRKMEEVKSRDLAQKKIQEELLLKSLDEVRRIKLEFKEKANEKGHLFAGVTKEMIVEELKRKAKFNIGEESIKLDKPIKEIGDHKIQIEILGKKADFELSVEAI